MKKWFVVLLCILPLSLFAEVLKEGSAIVPLSVVKDQFKKSVALDGNTKQIIVAFTKDQGNHVKAFLDAHPNYLSENNALYFMDATGVPSMIMSMFMLPKFKDYAYSIGIVDEKNDAAYLPKQEGKLTVISLENLRVSSIEYKETL